MNIQPISLHTSVASDLIKGLFVKDLKNRIYELERRMNGLDKVCDSDVKVKNLRVRAKYALADIEIFDMYGGHNERFNDCRYELSQLYTKEVL